MEGVLPLIASVHGYKACLCVGETVKRSSEAGGMRLGSCGALRTV